MKDENDGGGNGVGNKQNIATQKKANKYKIRGKRSKKKKSKNNENRKSVVETRKQNWRINKLAYGRSINVRQTIRIEKINIYNTCMSNIA